MRPATSSTAAVLSLVAVAESWVQTRPTPTIPTRRSLPRALRSSTAASINPLRSLPRRTDIPGDSDHTRLLSETRMVETCPRLPVGRARDRGMSSV